MTTPSKTHRLPDSPHGLPAADVLAALGVSFPRAFPKRSAESRLKLYGLNTISSRQKVSLLAILVHQFQSLVVALLAAAAGIAFYFREWEEGGAIVGVLVLNTLIGFVTEIKAVRSIEALRALGTRSARVCRGGRTRPIPAERLVPGDIFLLDAGDVVSADLRLVEASNLEADESTLTGESCGVHKTVGSGGGLTRGSPIVPRCSLRVRASLVAAALVLSSPLGWTPNWVASQGLSKRPSPRPHRLRRNSRGSPASSCG